MAAVAVPGGSLGGVQRKQLIDSRFAGTATETTAAAAGDKRERERERASVSTGKKSTAESRRIPLHLPECQ